MLCFQRAPRWHSCRENTVEVKGLAPDRFDLLLCPVAVGVRRVIDERQGGVHVLLLLWVDLVGGRGVSAEG